MGLNMYQRGLIGSEEGAVGMAGRRQDHRSMAGSIQPHQALSKVEHLSPLDRLGV
jgi:hypothetical protein